MGITGGATCPFESSLRNTTEDTKVSGQSLVPKGDFYRINIMALYSYTCVLIGRRGDQMKGWKLLGCQGERIKKFISLMRQDLNKSTNII